MLMRHITFINTSIRMKTHIYRVDTALNYETFIKKARHANVTSAAINESSSACTLKGGKHRVVKEKKSDG